MARELHRWPSPWRPILKPCQFEHADPGFSRRGREGTHHRHARVHPLDMAESGPKAILWPTGRSPPGRAAVSRGPGIWHPALLGSGHAHPSGV
jgi:hypothetical protein